MVYVVDTHPVAWFLEGSPRLSPAAYAVLSDPTAQLVLPAIVLMEIKFLYSKKRISMNVEAVYRDLITATNCVVYPLDEHVVALAPTSLNIHDAIIVATALVYRNILKQPVAVITKDVNITRSGLIQTVW